jgi:hypothetical protein
MAGAVRFKIVVFGSPSIFMAFLMNFTNIYRLVPKLLGLQCSHTHNVHIQSLN